MRLRTLASLATIGLYGLVTACSSDKAAPCTSDSQCGTGHVCDTGFCKAASARTVGQSCSSDGDCSVGSSCATAMPSGLCTYACAGDACPTGAGCTDLRASGSGLFCATACTTDAQCRSGYACCAGLGACVPAAQCPAQNRPASATLGKSCASNGQCTGPGEICVGVNPSNPEFPGGACTAACNPSDQSTCPSGSTCVSTSTGSFCFAQCASGCSTLNPQLPNCSSGVCRSSTASPSCNPNGAAPTPVNGGSVNASDPMGVCERTMQTGALQILPTPTGQQKVGSKLTFTVPPGTGTISILSQGITTADISVTGGTQPPDNITFQGNKFPNTVVPTMLKDPTGKLIYDDDPVTQPPADPSTLDAFYGGASPWAGMMTVPNASPLLAHTALRGGLVPGTWEFLVNDFALECTNPQHTSVSDCGNTGKTTSTYDIQVVLKPGVAPATGTVNVAFYSVSDSAATLIANPNFTRVTQQLAHLYAAAGLCIGKVTVYDLPAWAQSKFGGLLNADDDTACGDLSQLFTLSVPGNQINFFLVNGFSTGAGNPLPVIGIDGTIPGPSSFGGTVNSGAAVSAANLDATTNCNSSFAPAFCGPDQVAYTAAHEGGHFLGLYHTTERHGDAFDPLSDTKKCACESCAQPSAARNNCASVNPFGSPPLMDNSLCISGSTTPECGGGANLMFWLIGPESAGSLSPQQGQVMRANPVAR